MRPSPSTRKGIPGFTLAGRTPTAQTSRGVRTRHYAGGTLAT